MIVASKKEMQPGTIEHPTALRVHGAIHAFQPIFVMRECTAEEYLREYPQDVEVVRLNPRTHYYEVTTD